MRIILAALVLLCGGASAASPLRTLWSLDVSFPTRGSLMQSHGEVLLVKDSNSTLLAINATSGAMLWTHPPRANTSELVRVHVNEEKETVSIWSGNYVDGVPQEVIKTVRLSDGHKVSEITLPKGSNAFFQGQDSILGGMETDVNRTAGTYLLRAFRFSLSTGEILFNISLPQMYNINAGWFGKGIFILQGFRQGKHPQLNGWVGCFSFDLETGEFLCEFPQFNYMTSGAITVQGIDNFVVGRDGTDFTAPYAIYNAQLLDLSSPNATCVKQAAFSKNVKNFLVDTESQSLFATSGSPDGKENVLARVTPKTGAVMWNASLGAGKYSAVGNTAFQSDAIITTTQGRFAALNVTTGMPKWALNLTIPYGPLNSNGQQVFPLGHSTLFVPNLQGYVVIDTANGGTVKELNEHNPVTGAASFMGAKKPFVVFGEVKSGKLVAKSL